MNWGLGPKKKPPLSKTQRLLYHLLKDKDPKKAYEIRMGIDSDEDNPDIPPKVEVPVAPAAVVPHKRKRAVVKTEPKDPEFELRPSPPKRAKTKRRKVVKKEGAKKKRKRKKSKRGE